MFDINKVTVIGTGTLGSQIAFQAAYSGFPVTVYDLNEEAVEKAKNRFKKLAEIYIREVPGSTDKKIEKAFNNISYTTELFSALGEADLAIEAIPENLEIKKDLYNRMAKIAPAKTIFATNSSTFIPSELAGSTDRPKQFLALHFANHVWKFNIAEIMDSSETDSRVIESVEKFVQQIGLIPILLNKEKSGYILNSLLVPFLKAALELVHGGYAEPKNIDSVWRVSTSSPVGPFQIYDIVGINTIYNILVNGGNTDKDLAAWIKENYIDKGKLGIESGEGFYKYH